MNLPNISAWARAWASLAVLVSVAPLAAQAPVSDWALLSQTIDSARTRAHADEQRLCDMRDKALRDWTQAQLDRNSKPDALAKAATTHGDAVVACASARQQRLRADALWEQLNLQVGRSCEPSSPAGCPQAEIARQLFLVPSCEGQPKPQECQERSVATPRAAVETLTPELFKDLMKTAAKAQAEINEIKKNSTDAWAIGDAAARTGLSQAALTELSDPGNREARQRALDTVEQGDKAFRAAAESRSHLGEAQRASNELVREALKLAICEFDSPCDSAAKQKTYANAQAARLRFEGLIAQAKAQYLTAKEERWKQELIGLSPKDRDQTLRYLKLLDDNPDAKALVGSDAALISASSKGTEAVIRLSLNDKRAGGLRRWSLSFAAPLSDGEATIAERRADKLSSRPNVGLTLTTISLLPAAVFGGKEALASYGLTATVGRDKPAYLDPSVPEVTSVSTKPRGLALAGTLIIDDHATHSLKVERQRTWELGDATVVCPLPAAGSVSVPCLSGRLGLPRQTEATVTNYEYRRQTAWLGSSVGIGLGATYNSQSREFDLSIPIYFIASADSTTKELNAGFRIGLMNKRDPAQGRGTSFGFFVSTPFTLGAK